MKVIVGDFGLEWKYKDGEIHKADDDNLIKAYEKQEEHDKEVRNKAINEFAKKIKEATYQWFKTGTIAVGMIDEIADQMKEVGE